MAAVRELDQLKDLIVSSIDLVKQDLLDHNDPALSLSSSDPHPHPIHSRADPAVVRSLKTIAASAQILRALCDPTTYLNDTIYGYHDETALFVACQADVANLLGDGELSGDELAAHTGVDGDKLSRYLRNLCNSLIFRETAPNHFANNALSTTFRSEAKRAYVGHCADEVRVASCKTWDALTLPDYAHSTEANKAPFNIAFNTPLTIFEWYSQVRPDIGLRAKSAMAGKPFNLRQYLSLYPWDSEKPGTTIIDVGGGIGSATLPVLRANPHLKLQIQDLADTGPKFEQNLKENYADVAESGRASFVAHDFFQPQPQANADLFFLRHVIHDWPDSEAARILANLAAAMGKDSKLLICEHVIFPTYRQEGSTAVGGEAIAPEPLLANWGAAATSRLDLQVLTCLNAKQRTESEFRQVASRAGLEVVRVWRNLGDEAVIECRLP